MNKKTLITIISAVAVVALAVVGAIFFFGNDEGETPEGDTTAQPTAEASADPTGEATGDPTEDANNETPEPIETGDPEFPTSPDYWNGEAQPGLCTDMQEWFLADVQPKTYGDAGATLEEDLVPAAEEGREMVEGSDADAETKEIFTALVDSVENYGKFVGDPAAPEQQVIQAVSDQMTASEEAKAHCGW